MHGYLPILSLTPPDAKTIARGVELAEKYGWK